MRDKMLKYGDSLVVVGDDGIIKVHVHTNTPGDVLQEALAFGQLLTIKIERNYQKRLLRNSINNFITTFLFCIIFIYIKREQHFACVLFF